MLIKNAKNWKLFVFQHITNNDNCHCVCIHLIFYFNNVYISNDVFFPKCKENKI